jgi:hypothetical protein
MRFGRLNREKFETGEKRTLILYAHRRGKTALHVLEHSSDRPQQVHTENFKHKAKFPIYHMDQIK